MENGKTTTPQKKASPKKTVDQYLVGGFNPVEKY